MSIRFSCSCGNIVNAPDGTSGKKGKCKKCGAMLTIPFPEAPKEVPEETYDFADEPPALDAMVHKLVATPAQVQEQAYSPPPMVAAAMSAPVPGSYRPRGHGIRRFLYLVLLVILIPLGLSTLHGKDEHGFETRLEQTVKHHPEIAPKIKDLMDNDSATEDDLMNLLPDHKVEGATLSRDSWGHWGMAGISAAVFLAASLLLFPPGNAKWWQLVLIGIGTGTAGILLLLAIQWIAFHVPLLRGRSIITLIVDFLWLIGQSYKLALGDYGFVLSFLGFTAGVGFCEETCKALPLIFRARSQGYTSWRDALVWGLVSGVGFGVSEGITYSSDFYNGYATDEIYWVRFVSCVGLHAIWAAAIGIMIFRYQDNFRAIDNLAEWLGRILQVIIVPMILHGLYDTLLKMNYDLYALITALASFGWLAYQIERAERHFGDVQVERA